MLRRPLGRSGPGLEGFGGLAEVPASAASRPKSRRTRPGLSLLWGAAFPALAVVGGEGARRSQADVLVTESVRDSPAGALDRFGITVTGQDDFLLGMLDLYPEAVIRALRR
jgi:hypothetical protein